ncbi:MAG TPA: hypothetical protein DDW50_00595 [Firmicutes bacterium]|jgi:hypothetical protein|nr:hypothetical protein [Bacillota bacterium]
MKRTTKVSFLVALVILISPLILSPILFHKKNQAIEPNTVVAENNNPTSLPKKEVSLSPSSSSDSFSQNESENPIRDDQTLKPKPQPVTKNTAPNNQRLNPDRKARNKKEKLASKVNDKPVISKNDPKVSVVNDSANQSSTSNNESTENAKWGVAVIANPSTGDVAVTYRLIKLSLFNGSNFDVLAGTKEAGVGLSKCFKRKWGVGLNGTVSYENGDKNLGVYMKYNF